MGDFRARKPWLCATCITIFIFHPMCILLELGVSTALPKGIPPNFISILNRKPFESSKSKCFKIDSKCFNQFEIIQTLQGRVAKVVTVHDDLLTQWRPIKMSKFHDIIFLILTTSNYLWTSEVSKNQGFKSQLFSSSHSSN